MAHYIQMTGCDNCASCTDIFPPEAPPAPAPGPVLPGSEVTVNVTVPPGEAHRLPWWIWLVIGVGLGYIAND